MPPAPATVPPTLQLVLLDDNPSFRAGLRVWLEQFSDIQILGAGRLQEAESLVAQHFSPLATGGLLAPASPRSLLILCLPVQATESATPAFRLCRVLRDRTPALPILMLGASAEPVLVAAAKQSGASGFWLRSGNPDALLATLRRVATGQAVWIGASAGNLSGLGLPGPLAQWRRTLRQTGIGQMEGAIATLTTQLQNPTLSPTERLLLEGRLREVRAARWLVKRLLATPALPEPTAPAATTATAATTVGTAGTAGTAATAATDLPSLSPTSDPAATALERTAAMALETLETRITARSLRAILFEAVLSKLQSSVQNLTETPLETDILRADRKQELFGLLIRKIEDLLDDLRLSQVSTEQLTEKRSQLLLDLWQAGTSDFFGKYYTLSTSQGDLALVDELLSEAATVQADIFDTLPYVEELLSHLLFQTPLTIDGVPYAAGNPEAVLRAELLLSHTVIQLANGVMQPLLNRFSDLEVIKQNYYDRRLISTREVERFRNDLSWHYRLARYVSTPRDMFESQYRLLSFQPRGIQRQSIYAPRRTELEQLRGIPYAVTLALETRDAIAPRVRTAISVVGSSLVYVLTEVLGRGIGLIGRGILKGVGNVWQETRYSRNSERQR